MLSLSFGKETAIFVYKYMTGESAGALTADVIDAAGELTTIISGQARVKIEKIGYKLSASLPTVIVGQNVEVRFITKLPVITLPFGFDAGGTAAELFTEFSFNRKKAPVEF